MLQAPASWRTIRVQVTVSYTSHGKKEQRLRKTLPAKVTPVGCSKFVLGMGARSGQSTLQSRSRQLPKRARGDEIVLAWYFVLELVLVEQEVRRFKGRMSQRAAKSCWYQRVDEIDTVPQGVHSRACLCLTERANLQTRKQWHGMGDASPMQCHKKCARSTLKFVNEESCCARHFVAITAMLE